MEKRDITHPSIPPLSFAGLTGESMFIQRAGG